MSTIPPISRWRHDSHLRSRPDDAGRARRAVRRRAEERTSAGVRCPPPTSPCTPGHGRGGGGGGDRTGPRADRAVQGPEVGHVRRSAESTTPPGGRARRRRTHRQPAPNRVPGPGTSRGRACCRTVVAGPRGSRERRPRAAAPDPADERHRRSAAPRLGLGGWSERGHAAPAHPHPHRDVRAAHLCRSRRGVQHRATKHDTWMDARGL